MPEGDTIFRTARTLRHVLAGRALTSVQTAGPVLGEPPPVGVEVTGVTARGKNLIVAFSDGSTLYTHMRMTGSWHVYRPGERWRKPARRARVVLENAHFTAVCFSAPVVEFLAAGVVERDRRLHSLGPDLLDPAPDLVEARRRLRALDGRTIAEALLTQSAVAGIGNVYKSETLFLCGVHPEAPAGGLDDDTLDHLLRTASELMRRNIGGGWRVTRENRDGRRLWVYGRKGEPCARCGETIRLGRHGLAARSTYWCPGCQPLSAGASRTPPGSP